MFLLADYDFEVDYLLRKLDAQYRRAQKTLLEGCFCTTKQPDKVATDGILHTYWTPVLVHYCRPDPWSQVGDSSVQ